MSLRTCLAYRHVRRLRVAWALIGGIWSEKAGNLTTAGLGSEPAGSVCPGRAGQGRAEQMAFSCIALLHRRIVNANHCLLCTGSE